MKLQQFGGGLSTRLAPQMIQQNQGVVYSNIDNTSGTLKPAKDRGLTGIEIDRYAHYYEADAEWVSRTIPTEYLEFQGTLYFTNNSSSKKRKNGVEQNLGIAAPTVQPIATGVNTVARLTEATALNSTTSGDLPSSNLSYWLINYENDIAAAPLAITVYSSNTDSTRADSSDVDATKYMGMGAASKNSTINTKVSTARTVTFSDFKGEITQKAELYRSYNGVWYLVDTITALTDTIVDDTEDISANTVLDTDLFSPFNGTYQYVYTYYNSVDGTESAPSELSDELELESGTIDISSITASTDPQVDTIRLYRVGGNIAQFAMVVELTNTTQVFNDDLRDSEIDARLLESDNYYEAPSGLRYISESYAMLFGAVDSNLRFTPIGVPNAWPPEYSIEFDTDITGIGPVANGLLVMTKNKTYIVTGTGPTTLAQQTLRGDQGCISNGTIQEVTKGMVVWASSDGFCVSSGDNVEVITKNALGKTTFYAPEAAASAVVDEVYYCVVSNTKILAWDYRFSSIFKEFQRDFSTLMVAEGELYGWAEDQVDLTGFLYKLFQGTNNLNFTYVSPRYTEGSLTLPKTYKKFYFRHNGDIIVNILINDVLVATKELTGNDTTEFSVPQDKQRGFYVQFEITGTGELEEIEYTASETRNG